MSTDNAPKPGPYKPKRPPVVQKKPEPSHEPKKAYKPKPHLTQRPFSDDELLAKLIKDTGVEESK